MSLRDYAVSHGGLLKLSFVPLHDLCNERHHMSLIGPITLPFPPALFDEQDKAV